MKSLDTWLSEYGVSHQNKTNKLIHYLCVPAIYMTVVGLLWSVPFPQGISQFLGSFLGEGAVQSGWINWASVLTIPALVFYFRLSAIVGLGMLLFTVLTYVFVSWWQQNMAMSVLMMSVIVFVVAWILQFYGHKVEGKKPSFFKDVQFLMIGPVWILCHSYSKLNIKY